jgi:cellulose biosynthesis protein BcsQ
LKAIAVGNGKGGVGKSSTVANAAGLAAASGWRVLVVDLDPQGNVGRDLGYLSRKQSDQGKALFTAAQSWFAGELQPPRPLQAVRPHLDVLPAGRYTEDLIDILASRARSNPRALKVLHAVLAPLATYYGLILFDCPPARGIMQDAALATARHLVIPTTFDEGSLDGLTLMAEAMQDARERNPELELLGVVLFNFAASASQLISEVQGTITTGLGDIAPVWMPPIRTAPRAAHDTRARGLLAHEYEAAARRRRGDGDELDVAAAAEFGLVRVDDPEKQGEAGHGRDAAGARQHARPPDHDGSQDHAGAQQQTARRRYSSAAGTLASDYQAVTNQLLAAFVAKSGAIQGVRT